MHCDWASIHLITHDESWPFIVRVITIEMKCNCDAQLGCATRLKVLDQDLTYIIASHDD